MERLMNGDKEHRFEVFRNESKVTMDYFVICGFKRENGFEKLKVVPDTDKGLNHGRND
jgi:hypothetical protein